MFLLYRESNRMIRQNGRKYVTMTIILIISVEKKNLLEPRKKHVSKKVLIRMLTTFALALTSTIVKCKRECNLTNILIICNLSGLHKISTKNLKTTCKNKQYAFNMSHVKKLMLCFTCPFV